MINNKATRGDLLLYTLLVWAAGVLSPLLLVFSSWWELIPLGGLVLVCVAGFTVIDSGLYKQKR